MSITFGKTVAWPNGKTKENRTPIRREGVEVGEIRGVEELYVGYTYTVEIDGVELGQTISLDRARKLAEENG